MLLQNNRSRKLYLQHLVDKYGIGEPPNRRKRRRHKAKGRSIERQSNADLEALSAVNETHPLTPHSLSLAPSARHCCKPQPIRRVWARHKLPIIAPSLLILIFHLISTSFGIAIATWDRSINIPTLPIHPIANYYSSITSYAKVSLQPRQSITPPLPLPLVPTNTSRNGRQHLTHDRIRR